jgi:hypothetical protein
MSDRYSMVIQWSDEDNYLEIRVLAIAFPKNLRYIKTYLIFLLEDK